MIRRAVAWLWNTGAWLPILGILIPASAVVVIILISAAVSGHR